jgi:hypothetical protein
MSGAIPPLPHLNSWRVEGQLCLLPSSMLLNVSQMAVHLECRLQSSWQIGCLGQRPELHYAVKVFLIPTSVVALGDMQFCLLFINFLSIQSFMYLFY